MKKLLFISLTLLSATCVFAQDIEVKKFEPMEKDQTAALSPRKDLNGTACGLVKVALKEAGAEFEGNVMGDVQFTGNEYLVYLPNGTKRLGIKHPDYLPTTIVFADYGTKKVASGTTYELKVKTNKKKAKVDNSKKGMAVFNIKPSNAMLLIDGQIADGSGGAYTLSLPYGTHYYTVKLKDFSINNQPVTIDKNAKTVNVDLTDYYAFVKVKCDDQDAEIYINDELQGIASWEGSIVPGRYSLDIRKDGFNSHSKTIELLENDSTVCAFPRLKMIAGCVKVDYEPYGSEVYLDSKKVGVTPLVIEDVIVGSHSLKISKKDCIEKNQKINVSEGNTLTIKGHLKMSEKDFILYKAEQNDGCALNSLGDFFLYNNMQLSSIDPPCKDCLASWEELITVFNAFELKKSLNEKERIEEGIKWFRIAVDAHFVHYADEGKYYAMLGLSYYYSLLSDYKNSYYWAKRCYEEYKGNGWYPTFYYAWHLYHGKGVGADTIKALNLIRQKGYGLSSENMSRVEKGLKDSSGLGCVGNYWHFSMPINKAYSSN